MRRATLLIAALGLAACFDFAALKRDYGKADLTTGNNNVDGGGGDLADLSIDPDLSIIPDLAMTTDEAIPMDDMTTLASPDLTSLVDLRAAQDLTPPADLLPPPDLFINPDLSGACSPILPVADHVRYVVSSASIGNTECTKLAPCATLQTAINSVPADGSTGLILMAGGNYTHNGNVPGVMMIYGGFFSNFDCRDSITHATVIGGNSPGFPTLRGQLANGKQLLLDGLTIYGPGPTSGMPLLVLEFTGGGEAVVRDSKVATTPDSAAGSMASNVLAVKVTNGTFLLERTEIRVPSINAPTKRAVYLCGANATFRDVEINAILEGDTTGPAAVFTQDTSSGCVGTASTTTFDMFRTVIVATGGQNTSALMFDWSRNGRDQRIVKIQRSVLRVVGVISGFSVGLLSKSALVLDFHGSTINTGIGMMTHGIQIESTTSVSAILQMQDSIIAAGSMPMIFTGEVLSLSSGFGRNIFNPMNPNDYVVDNKGTLLDKNALLGDVEWGTPVFTNVPFQGDGYHLHSTAVVAKGLAPTCWGTEGGTYPYDIDGDPIPFAPCDTGADEIP